MWVHTMNPNLRLTKSFICSSIPSPSGNDLAFDPVLLRLY